MELLRLWSRRNQLQRNALGSRRHWMEYWREDVQCRRRTGKCFTQGWWSLCSFMDFRRDPGRAWPVFQALLQPTTSSRRPLLAAAISLGITEGALAELLADQFAKAVQTTVPVPAASPDAVPAAPHDRRVVFLCSTASTLCELQAALNRCPKPRSAPGIDGVTYQML